VFFDPTIIIRWETGHSPLTSRADLVAELLLAKAGRPGPP